MGTGFYSTGSANWKAGKSSQGLKWVIGEKGMYGVLMIYHGAARCQYILEGHGGL